MIHLKAGKHFINDIDDAYIRGEGSSVTTLFTNGIRLDDSKRLMDISGVKIINSNEEGTGVGLYSDARDKALLNDVQICGFQTQMHIDHTGVGTGRNDQKNHWFHSYNDLYLYESKRGIEFTNNVDTNALKLTFSGDKEPLKGSKPFNIFNTISINKGYAKSKHPVLIDGATAVVLRDFYMENNLENVCLRITPKTSGVELYGCYPENKNRQPLVQIDNPKFSRLMMYGNGTSGIGHDGRIVRGDGTVIRHEDSDYKYLRVHTERYNF